MEYRSVPGTTQRSREQGQVLGQDQRQEKGQDQDQEQPRDKGPQDFEYAGYLPKYINRVEVPAFVLRQHGAQLPHN